MNFRDYNNGKQNYITFIEGDFYPDYLSEAHMIYALPLSKFRELVFSSLNSRDLLRNITKLSDTKLRIQLLRIFRKYVSPDTSVEMLKKKTKIEDIISDFGYKFRDLSKVKEVIYDEGEIDPVLAALLFEYKDRGKKGYELTDKFFNWFDIEFSDKYIIEGPTGAGKDVLLSDVLNDFPNKVPADFIVSDRETNEIKVVGFARYDSDRGGSQEDDRISGNRDKVTIIREYNEIYDHQIKILFLNDGPGLLLGSMWEDYCLLEEYYGNDLVMVSTLKMLNERLTHSWID